MDLGNAEKHVREPTEAARRVALPQGGAAPSRTPSQPGNAQVKALYKN